MRSVVECLDQSTGVLKMSVLRHNVSLKQQEGSLLLEALISILLMSIAILALIGLQSAVVQQSGEAASRNQASILAGQLIGRMTQEAAANLDQYAYDGSNLPVSAAAKAWVEQVKKSLPNGRAVVSLTQNADFSSVDVTINWKYPGETNEHQYDYATSIVTNNDMRL